MSEQRKLDEFAQFGIAFSLPTKNANRRERDEAMRTFTDNMCYVALVMNLIWNDQDFSAISGILIACGLKKQKANTVIEVALVRMGRSVL